MFNILKNMASLQKELAELNSNKKVECFSKTVATDVDLLVDFSAEMKSIIKNGGKIVSAIPGTTTNSNNGLVYGKVAIQALPDLGAVDWKLVVSASVLAGVLSVATSVAGLPEVEGE